MENHDKITANEKPKVEEPRYMFQDSKGNPFSLTNDDFKECPCGGQNFMPIVKVTWVKVDAEIIGAQPKQIVVPVGFRCELCSRPIQITDMTTYAWKLLKKHPYAGKRAKIIKLGIVGSVYSDDPSSYPEIEEAEKFIIIYRDNTLPFGSQSADKSGVFNKTEFILLEN